MIAYVKGTLAEVTEGNAVVDVGGIGYNIKISAGALNLLPPVRQEVTFYTYTYVREDIFCLYGFLNPEDLTVFKLLITVNGVGPKGALGILSVMSARDLQFAIASADSKMIARAPGIGKKTAERVILDLRDKVSLEDALRGLGAESISVQDTQSAPAGARNQAIEALTALGYGAAEARKAVSRVEGTEDMDVEAILKAALKEL